MTFPDDVLEDGETVRWSGRPTPGAVVRRKLFEPVVGIGFQALAIYIANQAAAGEVGGSGAAYTVFVVPFIVAGLYFMGAPLWRWKQARSTVYAVTDRRLAIVTDWPGRRVRSFLPGELDPLDVSEGPDGRGDVVFQRVDRVGKSRRNRREFGFFGIAEVRTVAAAIEHLKADKGDHP